LPTLLYGSPASVIVRVSVTAIALHVDGHVSDGRATRLAVTETRTITLAGEPYSNVGNWTITAGP
jgi:hypothetical protein